MYYALHQNNTILSILFLIRFQKLLDEFFRNFLMRKVNIDTAYSNRLKIVQIIGMDKVKTL